MTRETISMDIHGGKQFTAIVMPKRFVKQFYLPANDSYGLKLKHLWVPSHSLLNHFSAYLYAARDRIAFLLKKLLNLNVNCHTGALFAWQ